MKEHSKGWKTFRREKNTWWQKAALVWSESRRESLLSWSHKFFSSSTKENGSLWFWCNNGELHKHRPLFYFWSHRLCVSVSTVLWHSAVAVWEVHPEKRIISELKEYFWQVFLKSWFNKKHKYFADLNKNVYFWATWGVNKPTLLSYQKISSIKLESYDRENQLFFFFFFTSLGKLYNCRREMKYQECSHNIMRTSAVAHKKMLLWKKFLLYLGGCMLFWLCQHTGHFTCPPPPSSNPQPTQTYTQLQLCVEFLHRLSSTAHMFCTDHWTFVLYNNAHLYYTIYLHQCCIFA